MINENMWVRVDRVIDSCKTLHHTRSARNYVYLAAEMEFAKCCSITLVGIAYHAIVYRATLAYRRLNQLESELEKKELAKI